LKISLRAGDQGCKTGNKTDRDKFLDCALTSSRKSTLNFIIFADYFNTKSNEKEEIFNL